MSDTCGRVEAKCICTKPDGHDDGVHVCNCGGSWKGDQADETFEVVMFPGGISPEAVAKLLGASGDVR